MYFKDNLKRLLKLPLSTCKTLLSKLRQAHSCTTARRKMPQKKKAVPFSYDTTYNKAEEPLACTNKSDSLQLVLATAKGKPGHGMCMQCLSSPSNRTFRRNVSEE